MEYTAIKLLGEIRDALVEANKIDREYIEYVKECDQAQAEQCEERSPEPSPVKFAFGNGMTIEASSLTLKLPGDVALVAGGPNA